MLSVCIPVFNTDVTELAYQLSQQAAVISAPVEIFIVDDASLPEFKQINRQVRDMPGVSYFELRKNLGRSAIRNYLAGLANYAWILFLDGDSLIPGNHFLQRYTDSISGSHVICGGTRYDAECPPPDQRLRWMYGRQREQISPEQRTKKGFAITANNFMISREVFLQYRFREEIRDYGHEDTVLGYDLLRAGLTISHIDNPVIHAGLESSVEYLEKSRKAIENLLFISRQILSDPVFDGHSGLLKARATIKSLGLLSLAGWLFRKTQELMENNLKGQKPTIWIFDLYRIGLICNLK